MIRLTWAKQNAPRFALLDYDIDGPPLNKGDNLIKCLPKIQFIAVLLDVAQVWGADGIV